MSNLTDYKKHPKLIKFSSAADPVPPVLGAALRDMFINTTSGEIFTCVDIGLETWRGSLGTLVQASLTPVVHYSMDNFSGSTVLDEGANNYDLVPVGGTPAVVAGISSNAVSFTTAQYYESSSVATNLQSLNTGAMSYWFKITDGPYTMGPHLTDSSGLNSVLLFYNTASTPAFSFNSGSGAGGTAINAWKNISPPLDTAEWHHVVYQFTGTVMEFYLNGVLTPIDSGGSITTAGWFSNTTEDMKIRISNGTQNGIIDAVKFFDKHLTPSEVTTLYTEFDNNIVSPTDPSLLGMYTMDNLSGASGNVSIIDESTYGADTSTIAYSNVQVGKFGNAIAFSGPVTRDNTEFLANSRFSISTWVKVAAGTDIKGIAGMAGVSQIQGFLFSMFDLSAQRYIHIRQKDSDDASNFGTIYYDIATSKTVGDWIHVVANITKVSGESTELFVDGLLVGTSAPLASTITYANNTFKIGGGYGNNAVLDQFRIFDRFLTPTEALALYNETL